MKTRLLPSAPSLLQIRLQAAGRVPRACIVAKWLHPRRLTAATSPHRDTIPLRKHLKDEAKRKKAQGSPDASKKSKIDGRLEKWELTVGIEVHAELNTACKLFSSAPAISAAAGDSNPNAVPNTHVALFDAAMPGSQPQFQHATLLPALRAAIALGCEVQRKSGWDRKHYFHWDQPNGYQITQYYSPFAKSGSVSVGREDGVPLAELAGAESVTIGIKQIQMEQDTAKTTTQSPAVYHVDLNRAGHPLIEIITLPHIHSPRVAAAVVRKIQAILKSVDACTTGMELGGLRADVNVSVRERGTTGIGSSYSGVSGLGQRTEIKNLSSFAAIEHAIIAERDRQISVLEAGGVIEGETRGWALGATETTRLRGKEGEVDYRYMPDADLPPLIIGTDLVEHLKKTLPELPDETVERVQQRYGVSGKDARTLVALDDGERFDYMEEVVELVKQKVQVEEARIGKMTSNWILHEVGGLLTTSNTEWSRFSVPPAEMAGVLSNLLQKQITSQSAKRMLHTLSALPTSNERPSVEELIDQGNLRLRPLDDIEYHKLAAQIIAENPKMVAAVHAKHGKGKLMWFVGEMVRRGEEGTVEPEKAREVLMERLIL